MDAELLEKMRILRKGLYIFAMALTEVETKYQDDKDVHELVADHAQLIIGAIQDVCDLLLQGENNADA